MREQQQPIDPKLIEQAKKWAELIGNNSDRFAREDTSAAAEVITALPDFPMDGLEIGKALNRLSALDIPEEAGDVIDGLWKILPAPKPRTLADMTPEERAECQWMQADHVEHGRVIITHPGDTYIYYMKPSGLSGGVSNIGSDRITPLPDLPRMVWPSPESDVSIISPKIDTSTEHDDSVNMTPNPQPCEMEIHVSDEDKAMIAAAPEAVAEVVRLRRELEELLDDLGQANYGGNPDPNWYLKGQVSEAERVGRQLIRILNPKDNK